MSGRGDGGAGDLPAVPRLVTQLPDGRRLAIYGDGEPAVSKPAAVVLAGSPPGLVAALAGRATVAGWVPVVIRAPGVDPESGADGLVYLTGAPGNDDVWALLQARWRLVGVVWAGGEADRIEELQAAVGYLWQWLNACRPGVPWVGGVADVPVRQSWMARVLAATPAAFGRRWAVLAHPGSTGLVGGRGVPKSLLEQWWEGRRTTGERVLDRLDGHAHVDDVAAAYWACLRHLQEGGASGYASVGVRARHPSPVAPPDLPRPAAPPPRRRRYATIAVPPPRAWEDLLATVRGDGLGADQR